MKRHLALSLFLFVALAGCEMHSVNPIQSAIVAPVGPASAAVSPAIEGAAAANKDALSKIASSAGAIAEINAGQPASPRTTGITNETEVIKHLAGEPTPEDKLAAANRALIVAQGKAEEIDAAYQKANTEAQTLKAQVKVKEDALHDAQTAATAEQANLQKKYQAELDRVALEANTRVQAAVKDAQDKAKAEQRRTITWIFFGLGSLLVAGGIVVLLTASSVPMFGPRAGFAICGAGAGLIGLGVIITQIQNFMEAHPWVLGAGLAACVAAAAVAAGLIWANHHHHVTAPATPPPASP